MPSDTDDIIVVSVAVSSIEEGRTIASALIEKRLAACVQLMPIQSVFRWQGRVEEASETLLLIKTQARLFSRIETLICALHSYEVPEIVATPASASYGPYREWLLAETDDGFSG